MSLNFLSMLIKAITLQRQGTRVIEINGTLSMTMKLRKLVRIGSSKTRLTFSFIENKKVIVVYTKISYVYLHYLYLFLLNIVLYI
jgi:hypothetical protein